MIMFIYFSFLLNKYIIKVIIISYLSLTTLMKIFTRNLYRFSVQSQAKEASNHFTFAKDIPASLPRTHMNLFQSINSAIDIALETDHTYISFFI